MLLMLAQIDPNRAVEVIADGGTRGLIWALCAAIVALSGALLWLGRRHVTTLDTNQKLLLDTHAAHAAALRALVEETTRALTSVTGSVEDILEGVGALQDASRVLQALSNEELTRATGRRSSR